MAVESQKYRGGHRHKRSGTALLAEPVKQR